MCRISPETQVYLNALYFILTSAVVGSWGYILNDLESTIVEEQIRALYLNCPEREGFDFSARDITLSSEAALQSFINYISL